MALTSDTHTPYQVELLRFIMENVRDFAVIMFDLERRITLWNAGAERLLEWSEAEIVGQSADIFFVPEDQERDIPEHECCTAREQGKAEEERWHVRRSGSRFWGSGLVQPVTEGGELRGYLKIFRDLTVQKAAQEAQEKARAIATAALDSLTAHIALLDANGCIVAVNKAWTQFNEDNPPASHQISVGVNYLDICDRAGGDFSGEAAPAAKGVRAVLEGLLPVFEMDYPCPSPTEGRWYRMRVTPYLEEGLARVIVAHESITVRMKAEIAVLAHQAEIEALNVRLRRAMQETHHRVKNNLQVVVALSEIQAAEGAETVPASALQRISQHARTLAMIHDLLAHETKTVGNADSMDARVMLQKLMPLVQTTVGGRHVTYDADEIHLPLNQGASLALLVNELLSNAIKHGKGNVEMTLKRTSVLPSELERRRVGRVELTVCDDGPGFPPGFNADEAAHTGLELVEGVARLDLRGKIRYENRKSGGGRVVVTFPLAE